MINKNKGFLLLATHFVLTAWTPTMKVFLLLGLGLLALLQGTMGQSAMDDLVDTAMKWKKACEDFEGNKYKKNQKLTGMCMEFTCSFKKKKYSWKAKVTNSLIYPQ